MQSNKMAALFIKYKRFVYNINNTNHLMLPINTNE